MGVYVRLGVITDRVDEATWQGIYADARRIAAAWTPKPLGIAWRSIGAERVGQYTTDIERSDGLSIVGDASSRLTGESFLFPSTIARRRLGDRSAASSGDSHSPDESASIGWRELFDRKTQGLPYHTLIVALGMLVEHRLPTRAMVHGDISRADVDTASRRLTEILGEPVGLPAIADPPRLRARLASTLAGDELERELENLAISDCGDALAADLLGTWLSVSEPSRVNRDLEYVARACDTPARLDPATRKVFSELVATIRSYMRRAEVRAQVESWGAVTTREMIARATVRDGLRLTATAWDEIETADLDELAFLLSTACMTIDGWHIHHAVRALLENPTLREL